MLPREAMPPYDIQERAFEFAASVVRLCHRLSDAHPVTRRLSWQLLDAGTSVGANLEEADAGQTKPDFRSKIAVARKECFDAHFWLRLIVVSEARLEPVTAPLLDEARQLKAILTTIKKNSEEDNQRGD